MFMLYALAVGFVIGLLVGGTPRRLAEFEFRWAPLALVGLAVQVALFSGPASGVVGDLGPPIYVASTLAVVAVVVRNVTMARGFAIVALGAVANVAAIVANGGYMPVTPGALASSGHATAAGYSNSVAIARPAFEALVDRFALPAGLPFANVFSIGDAIIGLGIVLVIAAAMRPGAAVERVAEAPGDASRVGTSCRPRSTTTGATSSAAGRAGPS